jgi:hypothetical protein
MNAILPRFLPAALLLLSASVWAQDDDERVYAVSCSLYVKTNPYTPDPGDVSGRAMVEATLCDKSGIPIPGEEIKITTTCGTLSCPSAFSHAPKDSVSQDRSCYITDRDGKIQVFLYDISFNKPGRVKASCVYSEIKVQASSSFLITRKVIKKGSRKKTSSRTRASSVQ